MPPADSKRRKLKYRTFGYSGENWEGIAEFLDSKSGTDYGRPDGFLNDFVTQWSPDQLRYLFDSYTGGMGVIGREFADAIQRTVAGRDFDRIPIVRAFVTDQSSQMLQSRFYEALEDLDALKIDYERAWEEEDMDRLSFLEALHKPKLLMALRESKSASWYSRMVNELRRAKKAELRAGNKEADTAAEDYEQMQLEYMYEFLKEFDEAEKLESNLNYHLTK
jgi:hypothetical protein